ncbi:MAG: hypothetical protein L0Y56_12610, partial [Nitrospira sp.]|nr:hypothetical protein [Nitrospira sp.]
MRFKFLYISLLTGILLLVYPLVASSASPSPPSLVVKSGEVLFITVKVAGVDPVVTGEFRNR